MGTHPIFESDFDCLTEKMNRITGRQFSTSSKLNRLFHSQWKRNNVDLPDHVKTMDSISAEEWNKDHGPKIPPHYFQEDSSQFKLKPISNKFFEKRRVHDNQHEIEIDIIPTLQFRQEEDAFGEDRAFEGIYDMIDIMGNDPAITPDVLCHGHDVYRAVDLGIAVDARDQSGDDPRKHIAELRTLYRISRDNRRHMYQRVENQWMMRYHKRVNFVNRCSAELHG